MKKIYVSDVTLKAISEEEVSYAFREKLSIASQIDASGIDAIELPTLKNSKEDEVIYRTIASAVKNAIVKIPVGDNVESAYNCIKGANKRALQISMPVSTAQMEYFYHLKAPAMQAKIEELIKNAKEYSDSVEFVAKDAFRAEEGFLNACIKTAYDAGATEVTICDDAGIAFAEDYVKVVQEIKTVCPEIKVYVEPSDALSMASAIAVASIKAGADGVKTSIKGKLLRPEVFADVIRAKGIDLGVNSNVNVTNIKTISENVDAIGTVETNEDISTLGENSTLNDVATAIKQLGYELSDEDTGKVYDEFKRIAVKKNVSSKELEAIIASTAMQVPSTYHLVNYVVNSGNIIPATANITLEKNGEKFSGVSTGDGPIDAAFHAIEQVVGHHYELDDFQVHAVTKGREAVGSSIIRLRADGKLYPGNGVSTDIVGACIRAYINALNKIVHEEN